jgi:hypothetical protein
VRVSLLAFLFLALVISNPLFSASVGRVDLDSLKTPIYSVDGTSFVRHNGDRYCNRPLYCNHMTAAVLAGDKPFVRLINGKFNNGCMMFALVRNGHGIWFQNASDITSRYECGRMSWTVADQSWGDTSFELEVVPFAANCGLAMRVQAISPHSGDQLVWVAGGVTQSNDSALAHYDVTTTGREALLHRGFSSSDFRDNVAHDEQGVIYFQAGRSAKTYVNCDVPTIPFPRFEDPAKLLNADAAVSMVLAAIQLPADPTSYFTLSTPEDINSSAEDEFALGLKRVDAIEHQVTVDTPDPWLNAAVSASDSVMDGIYRNGMYTHAGMRWSVPLIGWRSIFGPTAYGWHENVKAEARLCIGKQITESNKTTAVADPDRELASQSSESRMFGVGRINIYQPAHYDMQSLFFDQIQHAWRWTGDAELEGLLRRSLDLHCQYIQECFDPDKQGIYESYANTWPTDDQWYNGGGTSEETAYAYRAEQTALLLARRAGDEKDAEFHAGNIARVRKGFFDLLWNAKLGHPGAYREQGGLHRLHDSCWLYSIFCPIDAGLLDAEQSAEALNYTETELERIDLPYGGQQCWPSNWVPSIWSLREMWPGDNYQLALAYFQTGLADDGWNLLHGTYPQQLLFGPVPGDLGHPAGATDFSDCASTFCRTVVEGLFGYAPDYPNGVVKIAPEFPQAWDHASIKTPDFSLAFERKGNEQDYSITLAKAGNAEVCVPVSTTNVESMNVDGRAVKFAIEPGFGRSIVKISIPNLSTSRVQVICRDSLPIQAAEQITANVGDPISLPATTMDWHDPQGVLTNAKLEDQKLSGTVAPAAGDHVFFALQQVGKMQQWQRIKIHVTDPAGDAASAAKLVAEVPKNAHWASIDMQPIMNGDIRAIYQQDYRSPRPNTVSLRLATDGYSTWQMVLSPRNHPPEIGLENVHGGIVTDQGVPFTIPAGAKNIAFTSQWDNWPRQVEVPVNQQGDAIFFLLCGTTNPMEVRIANAELQMEYADGVVEKLPIVPPFNFWTLCPLDGVDYNYQRDGFCLPKVPPATVQLGRNCRAIMLNWRLRPGVALKSVRLEALSEQVVIGLMGVTIMNPKSGPARPL